MVNYRAWHTAEEVLGAMIDGYDVFLDKRKQLFEDKSSSYAAQKSERTL